MISFNKVTKQYNDGVYALDDVTLEIKPGEFVSIIGPSGAGKTTLLKMISAEEQPTHGNVHFNDYSLHDLSHRHLPHHRQNIGMIFQDYRLLPHKTAFENVALMLEVAGRSDEEINNDVPYALDLVNITDKMSRFPHQLSEGEQQRLAIARAIIHQPKILLADEPTGNLDPVAAAEIIAIFKKLNDLGTTIIMTTHSKHLVDNLGKRVVTLQDGKIVRDDKKGTYTAPNAVKE